MRQQRMTDSEGRVFDFLVRFISEYEYPPTHQEIANGCGYKGPASAEGVLNRLTDKGYIVRGFGARTIKIADKDLARQRTGILLRFK